MNTVTANPSALVPAWVDRMLPTGPGREVELPSADSVLRYACHAWAVRAAAVARPHRLRPQCRARYVARFVASPALYARWARLFDMRRGSGEVDYPFLYARSVIALLQARILADLGVHPGRCALLRQRTRLHAPAAALAAAASQRVDCSLARAVRVGPTEVMVSLVTRLHDEGGRALATVEDGFLVRHLEVAYAVQAEDDATLRRAVSRLRRRGCEIDPVAAGVRMRQLYLAPGVARRFARAGGDPVPTGPLPWLDGRPGPVQQTYLRELVVRELAEWRLDLAELQLAIVGRARIGQTLRLLERQGHFELVDEAGRLIAHGRV